LDAQERFATLLTGAHNYLSQNRDPAKLTPQVIQDLGLVPLDWFGGRPFPAYSGNPVFETDSLLRMTKHNSVHIGLAGSYSALAPIIDRYGSQATEIHFPYEKAHTVEGAPNTDLMLVIEFDRAQLARAAELAEFDSKKRHESGASRSYI